MATSFLQFCASCETQITIPNNLVLYCSESCRRKDSSKPLPASFNDIASNRTLTPPLPSSPPSSPRTIAPPMALSGRSSPRPIPGLRIPTDFHDAQTDLDPTEWKPVIARRNGSSVSLTSSDAWHFLSQFHGGEESLLCPRRSNAGHRSTTSLSGLANTTMTTPSLAHTPSTEASSLNSNPDDISYMHTFAATRPLPPRHSSYYSSSAGATKGIELVMPHIGPNHPTSPKQQHNHCMEVPLPLNAENLASHSAAMANHDDDDDDDEHEHLWAKSHVCTPPIPAVSSFTTVLRLK